MIRASCVVRRASGATLVELLVALAIIGLVLGVSGLALGTLKAPRETDLALALRRARAEAIRTGAARTTHDVRFLPDGRAIGSGIDQLTGRPLEK